MALIPYDIKSVFYNVSISLRELFPKLNYSVLKELDTDIFEKIYLAYKSYDGGVLSDNGTKDFIIKSVYGIVPELINDLTGLVKVFLSMYYKNTELPKVLSDYLYDKLIQKESLKKSPINEVIYGKDKFFKFIRVQWEYYLRDLIFGTNDAKVNFSDFDIKAYIDNIFYEKFLEPVKIENIEKLPEWTHAGILYDENERYSKEYNNILKRIKELINSIKSYKDWLNISSLWAEVLIIFYTRNLNLDKTEFNKTWKMLEDVFGDWLIDNYSNLTSLSYTKGPVMVHQVPWYINYIMKKESYKKIVLLVFDGMSLDDWYVIRNYLREYKMWNIEEKEVFAWIPTLTSISRQAIFSGDIPIYFKETIFSTNYEEMRWKKFWMNQGVNSDSIYYMRNIIDFNEIKIDDIINNRKAKIVGIVINIIDKLMHGQVLSLEGMYQDINLWLKKSNFNEFLNGLSSKGYEIFITSDHGNISSVGQGNLNEGVVVEKAGERVRVYESGLDYGKAVSDNNAFKWTGFGLPDKYNFIICKENNTFSQRGEKVVSHGGASIEEVIVPFIHIRKEE